MSNSLAAPRESDSPLSPGGLAPLFPASPHTREGHRCPSTLCFIFTAPPGGWSSTLVPFCRGEGYAQRGQACKALVCYFRACLLSEEMRVVPSCGSLPTAVGLRASAPCPLCPGQVELVSLRWPGHLSSFCPVNRAEGDSPVGWGTGWRPKLMPPPPGSATNSQCVPGQASSPLWGYVFPFMFPGFLAA